MKTILVGIILMIFASFFTQPTEAAESIQVASFNTKKSAFNYVNTFTDKKAERKFFILKENEDPPSWKVQFSSPGKGNVVYSRLKRDSFNGKMLYGHTHTFTSVAYALQGRQYELYLKKYPNLCQRHELKKVIGVFHSEQIKHMNSDNIPGPPMPPSITDLIAVMLDSIIESYDESLEINYVVATKRRTYHYQVKKGNFKETFISRYGTDNVSWSDIKDFLYTNPPDFVLDWIMINYQLLQPYSGSAFTKFVLGNNSSILKEYRKKEELLEILLSRYRKNGIEISYELN